MPFPEQNTVDGGFTTGFGRLGERLVIGKNPRLQVPAQPMALDDGIRGHERQRDDDAKEALQLASSEQSEKYGQSRYPELVAVDAGQEKVRFKEVVAHVRDKDRQS